jgi:protein-S-isoprenylcysteine O-methyltransferase Ste14
MFYVIVQFGCIFYLIFNTHLNVLNYALIGIGFIIGLSAIIAMKLDNFNIQPALKSQHKLITNGIYHWIRHPMYTSVLTLCLARMFELPVCVTSFVLYRLYKGVAYKKGIKRPVFFL